jgi:hypothetical protein
VSWNLDANCRRSRRTRHESGRLTAAHVKRSLSPLCQAWSRRRRAPLPSAEGRPVFGARAALGLREGCPGDERSRGSPSHLLSAPPVVLGPALSNPGPGRNVGSTPRIQNPAPCCWYAPLPDLAAYRDGMGARPDAESAAGGRPRYVRCAGCLLDVRGGRRRLGPIRRSGPRRYFPFAPDPFQALKSPRVPKAQRKARKIRGWATFVHGCLDTVMELPVVTSGVAPSVHRIAGTPALRRHLRHSCFDSKICKP